MEDNISPSLHHSFNVHYAEKYGVHEAILIHHFQHWIEHNQRLNKNYHEERTWSYQTIKEIAAWFPYLTENQVRELLHSLCVGKGRRSKNEKEFEPVLIKNNFNKSKFDKTPWYAFKNEKMFTKGRKPTSRNQAPIDAGLSPHREGSEPSTIPDTKTDIEETDYNLLPPSAKTLDSPVLSVPVVVSPFLDPLDLDQQYKICLSRDHPPDKLKIAVERVLAWEVRKSDFVAMQTVLKRYNEWNEKPNKDFKKLQNERILEIIREYDGVSANGGSICIGKDYVEFSGGVSYVKTLNVNDLDFYNSLISMLESRKFPKELIKRLKC